LTFCKITYIIFSATEESSKSIKFLSSGHRKADNTEPVMKTQKNVVNNINYFQSTFILIFAFNITTFLL